MAQASVYPDDYTVDQQVIGRQRKMADILREQSMQPLQGQVVGGRFVAPSITQHLANLLKGYNAGQMQQDADAKERDIVQQQRESRATDLANLMAASAPIPATPETAGPALGADVGGVPTLIPATPGREKTPSEVRQAMAQALMGAHSPDLQAQSMQFMVAPKPLVVGRSVLNENNKVVGTDATWAEEQQAAREQRAADSAAKREDAKTLQQDRLDARREMANQSNETRQIIAGMSRNQGAKVPTGYRLKDDGSMEAVPGGPADTKLQGQFNQDTAALQGSMNSFDRLATAANEALNHPGLKSITGLRGVIPNMPGSDAADAQAKMNTLKSQVGFGVLQDMRNNSKTGGALGAVSDAEGKRLEANLAALENAQSEQQMRESLKKIVDYADQAKGRMSNAYNMKHGTPARRSTDNPAPSAGAGGFKIIGVA